MVLEVLDMIEKIKFDDRIIDILKKRLEERHDMDISDFNQYQIIELWVNKSIK